MQILCEGRDSRLQLLTFKLSDIIEFDNSYSYFRSKRVHYAIVVEEPNEEIELTQL